MNKLAFMVLLLACASYASHTYAVDTNRDGLSSVTLSLEGQENASVPFPDDASNIRIVGGSYRIINGTAFIQTGKTGLTTFSFTTSIFTTKTESGWKLAFTPPNGSAVSVYMPAYAALDNVFPQQQSVSSEGSRTLVSFDDPKAVTIYYDLAEQPQAQSDQTPLYLLAGAILLAAAIIAVATIFRGEPAQAKEAAAPQLQIADALPPAPAPQEKKPTLELTAGKKEMMETFNDNDLKIANYLLDNDGKCRRNELERKTGISKSSLAMALNRMEKRKIVEIDRTSTTHFVKLSEYFLRL